MSKIRKSSEFAGEEKSAFFFLKFFKGELERESKRPGSKVRKLFFTFWGVLVEHSIASFFGGEGALSKKTKRVCQNISKLEKDDFAKFSAFCHEVSLDFVGKQVTDDKVVKELSLKKFLKEFLPKRNFDKSFHLILGVFDKLKMSFAGAEILFAAAVFEKNLEVASYFCERNFVNFDSFCEPESLDEQNLTVREVVERKKYLLLDVFSLFLEKKDDKSRELARKSLNRIRFGALLEFLVASFEVVVKNDAVFNLLKEVVQSKKYLLLKEARLEKKKEERRELFARTGKKFALLQDFLGEKLVETGFDEVVLTDHEKAMLAILREKFAEIGIYKRAVGSGELDEESLRNFLTGDYLSGKVGSGVNANNTDVSKGKTRERLQKRLQEEKLKSFADRKQRELHLQYLLLIFIELCKRGHVFGFAEDECFVSSEGNFEDRGSILRDLLSVCKYDKDAFVEKMNSSVEDLKEAKKQDFPFEKELRKSFSQFCEGGFESFRKYLFSFDAKVGDLNLRQFLRKKGNVITFSKNDKIAKAVTPFLAEICGAKIREVDLKWEYLRQVKKKLEGEKKEKSLQKAREMLLKAKFLQKGEDHPSLFPGKKELRSLIAWMEELQKLEKWSDEEFEIGYFDFKDTYSLFLGVKEACLEALEDDGFCKKLKTKFDKLSAIQTRVFGSLCKEVVFYKDKIEGNFSFLEFAQKHLSEKGEGEEMRGFKRLFEIAKQFETYRDKLLRVDLSDQEVEEIEEKAQKIVKAKFSQKVTIRFLELLCKNALAEKGLVELEEGGSMQDLETIFLFADDMQELEKRFGEKFDVGFLDYRQAIYLLEDIENACNEGFPLEKREEITALEGEEFRLFKALAKFYRQFKGEDGSKLSLVDFMKQESIQEKLQDELPDLAFIARVVDSFEEQVEKEVEFPCEGTFTDPEGKVSQVSYRPCQGKESFLEFC